MSFEKITEILLKQGAAVALSIYLLYRWDVFMQRMIDVMADNSKNTALVIELLRAHMMGQ